MTVYCVYRPWWSLYGDFLFLRVWISWFPWSPYCGRCRNLELTILTNLFRHTCLHVNKLAFLSVFLSFCLSDSLCLYLSDSLTNDCFLCEAYACLSVCMPVVRFLVSLSMHASEPPYASVSHCMSVIVFLHSCHFPWKTIHSHLDQYLLLKERHLFRF